ncbi:MAG: hypothetical protein NT062_16550 [Proteobacteria bacterium]|nr:hypothetical protein [Pseudomonadota bacterium]
MRSLTLVALLLVISALGGVRASVTIIAWVALVGCDPDAPRPLRGPVETRTIGALTIEGVATSITGCAVGANARNDGTYLDLFYADAQRLRFTRGELHASPSADDDGSVLACTKLDRKWQAGLRAQGGGYWRGFLDVRCTGARQVEGRIEVTCGQPTAAELELLDRERAAHERPSNQPP